MFELISQFGRKWSSCISLPDGVDWLRRPDAFRWSLKYLKWNLLQPGQRSGSNWFLFVTSFWSWQLVFVAVVRQPSDNTTTLIRWPLSIEPHFDLFLLLLPPPPPSTSSSESNCLISHGLTHRPSTNQQLNNKNSHRYPWIEIELNGTGSSEANPRWMDWWIYGRAADCGFKMAEVMDGLTGPMGPLFWNWLRPPFCLTTWSDEWKWITIFLFFGFASAQETIRVNGTSAANPMETFQLLFGVTSMHILGSFTNFVLGNSRH